MAIDFDTLSQKDVDAIRALSVAISRPIEDIAEDLERLSNQPHYAAQNGNCAPRRPAVIEDFDAFCLKNLDSYAAAFGMSAKEFRAYIWQMGAALELEEMAVASARMSKEPFTKARRRKG